MGERTPDTWWAVNKRQDNKLENCCIWLVIHLNWKTPICFRPQWSLNKKCTIV
jgi:hypothetical protein